MVIVVLTRCLLVANVLSSTPVACFFILFSESLVNKVLNFNVVRPFLLLPFLLSLVNFVSCLKKSFSIWGHEGSLLYYLLRAV